MARKSYDKMYEEKKEEKIEAAPAEEPVVESAEAEPKAKTTKKSKVAEEIPAMKPFMGIVAGGLNLNVRRTPNGEIIAVIPEGAQVRVIDEPEDGWYKIESPKGFVMKKYINKPKEK